MIPRLVDLPRPAPFYIEFLAELRARGFEGDLSPSYADRTVLATDNSIYQVTPEAIAFPRGTEDLVRIARLLDDPRFHGLKLAPRGGGTGTNGQSLTGGLVVDVSRHMNRILDIDPERRRVRVQAGVVAGGHGQGPAQRGAQAPRPVLRPRALHLQLRHNRRHDQYGRVRPGLVPLRQD